MNYFKMNGDFGDFIQSSRNRLEDSLYSLNKDILELEPKNPMPSLVRKIIRNLDKLTQEDKIIWSKDAKGIFRGVVVENCLFSNYKIIIEKWNVTEIQGVTIARLEDSGQNYKISFLKGILATEKVEYISDLAENDEEMNSLFEIITRKLNQERN